MNIRTHRWTSVSGFRMTAINIGVERQVRGAKMSWHWMKQIAKLFRTKDVPVSVLAVVVLPIIHQVIA